MQLDYTRPNPPALHAHLVLTGCPRPHECTLICCLECAPPACTMLQNLSTSRQCFALEGLPDPLLWVTWPDNWPCKSSGRLHEHPRVVWVCRHAQSQPMGANASLAVIFTRASTGQCTTASATAACRKQHTCIWIVSIHSQIAFPARQPNG